MAAEASPSSSSLVLHLGFLEGSTPKWQLQSRFFPSKVGGKPSWLHLASLPSPASLLCPSCASPMVFLVQVYADREPESAFHRTLFVFMCARPECHDKEKEMDRLPFKVFRSQLPRRNDFYPFDAPKIEESWNRDGGRAEDHGTRLCRLCGCMADKHCAGCRLVSYCSKEHQTLDWKKGGHKEECKAKALDHDRDEKRARLVSLPEFELVQEPAEEEDWPESSDDDDDDDGEANTEEKRKFVRMKLAGEAGDLSDADVKGVDSDVKEGAAVQRFKEVVAHSREQVLRHCVGGRPLWISDENLPGDDVPPACQSCGGPRQFEFQIMPQLIGRLGLDAGKAAADASVDWGVLAVYTCKDSCDGGEAAYKTEFMFRQFP